MKVLLVGGMGRLERVYRQTAGALGMELVYCENKRGRLPQANHLAYDRVLVVTSENSHGLRDQAEELARRSDAPIAYLRTGSVSAVRKALEQHQ